MHIRWFFTAVFLLLLHTAQAQTTTAAPPNNLNQTDRKGLRQGMWWIQEPARMGEDAYTEFGTYTQGRKTGIWYRMDNMGQIIAIEQYRNNVLDGEVKYFDQGHLICIGHYRGLNPDHDWDTILVVHPITGVEKLVPISTERGTLRHGTWRYYDPQSGRLTREEDYQVDELLAAQDFVVSTSDSAYYQHRNATLPHMKKGNYKPPAGKRYRITE